MLTCANCGTQNEPGRKFCLECGGRLAVGCPTCGVANPPEAKFCGECGTFLGTRTDEAAPAAVATELRLISVMFVDLVGFTSLSERLDAEDVRELLDGYFATARQIVERHGGVIEKFIGDAVMAVWGTPVAHEDDAERAVRTALQLVEAIGQIEVGGTFLEGRAGVLTGEAVVTTGADDQWMVAGDLVNTAARLQSVAVPGTILVGEATYRAAAGAIAFEEVGEQALKGKETPVPSWRAVAVVARLGGSGRSATLEPPFVGRDEELRTLRDQFHATEREGKPRLLTIVGQAGIGKSRLAWELEKYLDGVVETILWHEGRSPSYGEGISYWALAEIVRGRSGIADSDDPETARQRLGAMLDEMVPDAVERRWIEPRLTGLLGLDPLPAESREELFAAWRTFFERLADQATTLLVFWDLQWADQGLLDFIEHLLTWARTSPLFVLAEARPELFERRPSWGATVRSTTTIHLEPLSDEDMRALLAGLVPDLPEHALRAIIERAEGVPLYAVETLRMLIGQGVLRPASDGSRFTLAEALPALAVPETLHALIAARLDALPPDDHALLTDAAVVGLSFTVAALEAVTESAAEETTLHLDRLVRQQLLLLDADPRSPERGQYRFVQGVVREVAYQSLAKRDRRAKHVAAARYFESLGDDELAGVLANHYLAAYQATPSGSEADALAAQARVALRAAADRATALHSLVGALTYLESAITVTADPHDQAMLHERAAKVASEAGRVKTGIDHARRARAIYGSLDDRLGVLRARTSEARSYLAEHGDKAARAILVEALDEVGEMPQNPDIAFARSELARALMVAGSSDAIGWADKVLQDPALVSPIVLVDTLITKATAQIQAGVLIEAEVTLRGAIAVADRLGDPMTSLRARNNLFGIIGPVNLDDVLVLVREMYEIAERYGQRTWVQQALGVAASTSFDVGRWDDWIPEMLEEEDQAGEYYRQWFRAEAARRLAYRGGHAEAEASFESILAADAVRDSVQGTAGVSLWTAELRMLQGRWGDAFEAAKRASESSDGAEVAVMVALFAAAAAADPARLQEAIELAEARLVGDQPMTIAIRLTGATLVALLEGRWDDARRDFVRATRLVEDTRNLQALALIRLVVGHLAGDRIPEAAAGLGEAESYFRERGAETVVSDYRAAAVASVPASGRHRSDAIAARGPDHRP